jgi:hypothetical protein
MRTKFSFRKLIGRFKSSVHKNADRVIQEINDFDKEPCYICGEIDFPENLLKVNVDPLAIYDRKIYFHEKCMEETIFEPEKFLHSQVDRALECQQKLSLEYKAKEERKRRELEAQKESEKIRKAKINTAQQELRWRK